MDEDELVDMVRDAIGQQRPYAGFFDWPERPIAEWGVANLFSEIAGREPGLPFRDVHAREAGQDPPDCEAVDVHGRPVAIEVTELVDGYAIAEVRRTGRSVVASWNAGRIRRHLDELLLRKDSKTLKGGPYHEYIVLIHTDEPTLTLQPIEAALSGHTFPPLKQVQRAYLILSYEPLRGGYPYFRLL